MTSAELADFRTEVRAALKKASKNSGRDIMHSFSKEAEAEAHVGPGVPPFAIICSRNMDLSVGRCAESP